MSFREIAPPTKTEPDDVITAGTVWAKGKKKNGDARRDQCSTAQEERLRRDRRHVGIRLPRLSGDLRQSRDHTMQPHVSKMDLFISTVLTPPPPPPNHQITQGGGRRKARLLLNVSRGRSRENLERAHPVYLYLYVAHMHVYVNIFFFFKQCLFDKSVCFVYIKEAASPGSCSSHGRRFDSSTCFEGLQLPARNFLSIGYTASSQAL